MTPQLGCFSWLLLVAVCAWPLSALGLGEGASIGGGVVLASLVVIGVGAMHSRSRQRDIEQGVRAAQDERP